MTKSFAYTEPSSAEKPYPGYMNVSLSEDGNATITIRESGTPEQFGQQSTFTMPQSAMWPLIAILTTDSKRLKYSGVSGG